MRDIVNTLFYGNMRWPCGYIQNFGLLLILEYAIIEQALLFFLVWIFCVAIGVWAGSIACNKYNKKLAQQNAEVEWIETWLKGLSGSTHS